MTNTPAAGFDRAAAVTRSLLGFGVVAGAFYLIVGIVQGIVRDGFDFGSHPLSALMLGDWGWVQRANLIVTGLMVLAATFGFARAMREAQRGRQVRWLLGAYGACLISSGIFAPDPVNGFPPGAESGDATAAGILHLAFGGIGFLALGGAAFAFAAWRLSRHENTVATRSRIAGAVVIVGFLAGAALATQTVIPLWVAVVAGWAWLAAAAIHTYRTVPHPDLEKRSR